jgi:hypothetical protein
LDAKVFKANGLYLKYSFHWPSLKWKGLRGRVFSDAALDLACCFNYRQ